MRRVLGEPTVSGALWDTVTSVGEGDETAYADALVAIGREFGYYCLEPVIEDWRTPGLVLDAILGGWPNVQGIWQMIARHQLGCFLASENMPPEVRRACARWSHVSLWAVARDGFLGRI